MTTTTTSNVSTQDNYLNNPQIENQVLLQQGQQLEQKALAA
ncbi:hypothetical protein SynBIOSU31_00193 [Synechococcus sp. BIOS-U3-1]|nr:hypothetical protein SynBIOSU31_00193 [Synechococcus sp. BIOS-U3-1]